MGLQEYAAIRDNFLRNGLESPMAYYKALMSDVSLADHQSKKLRSPEC